MLVFDAASGHFVPSEQMSRMADTAAAARAQIDAQAWADLGADAAR